MDTTTANMNLQGMRSMQSGPHQQGRRTVYIVVVIAILLIGGYFLFRAHVTKLANSREGKMMQVEKGLIQSSQNQVVTQEQKDAALNDLLPKTNK